MYQDIYLTKSLQCDDLPNHISIVILQGVSKNLCRWQNTIHSLSLPSGQMFWRRPVRCPQLNYNCINYGDRPCPFQNPISLKGSELGRGGAVRWAVKQIFQPKALQACKLVRNMFLQREILHDDMQFQLLWCNITLRYCY